MSIEGGYSQQDENINPSFRPIGSYEELIGFLTDMAEARQNLSGEDFALTMRTYWAGAVEYSEALGMTFEAQLFRESVIYSDNLLQQEREGELPNVPRPSLPQPLN